MAQSVHLRVIAFQHSGARSFCAFRVSSLAIDIQWHGQRSRCACRRCDPPLALSLSCCWAPVHAPDSGMCMPTCPDARGWELAVRSASEAFRRWHADSAGHRQQQQLSCSCAKHSQRSSDTVCKSQPFLCLRKPSPWCQSASHQHSHRACLAHSYKARASRQRAASCRRNQGRSS
jgi:hypothetical protein